MIFITTAPNNSIKPQHKTTGGHGWTRINIAESFSAVMNTDGYYRIILCHWSFAYLKLSIKPTRSPVIFR